MNMSDEKKSFLTNLSNKHAFLAALRRLIDAVSSQVMPKFSSAGICHNLGKELGAHKALDAYVFVRIVSEGWPLHSGDTYFPVNRDYCYIDEVTGCYSIYSFDLGTMQGIDRLSLLEYLHYELYSFMRSQ